jgi:hypothetical protein
MDWSLLVAVSGPLIASIATLALAGAGTGYAIANAPKAPAPPPPAPPPPPPPVPPPVPPAPTETLLDTGVSDARARLKRQRGVASTIFTSPLGISAPSQTLGG